MTEQSEKRAEGLEEKKEGKWSIRVGKEKLFVMRRKVDENMMTAEDVLDLLSKLK